MKIKEIIGKWRFIKYLFCKYEILRKGEWQPFGIKVEEQDSERNKDKDVDTSLSDYMDKRIKEISEEERRVFTDRR